MRRKSIKYVTFRRCDLRRSGFIAHRFYRSDCIQSFRVAHNSGHVRGSTLEPISAVVIRPTYFLNARCIRFLLLPRPISTLLGRQPVRGRRAAGCSVASGCASFCRSVDPRFGPSLPRRCRAPSAQAFGASGKRPQTPARRARIGYPGVDRRRMPSIPHRADASGIVACVAERFHPGVRRSTDATTTRKPDPAPWRASPTEAAVPRPSIASDGFRDRASTDYCMSRSISTGACSPLGVKSLSHARPLTES